MHKTEIPRIAELAIGETYVTFHGPTMTFEWRPPDLIGLEHTWTTTLPFEGLSAAIHSPSNLIAVSGRTDSDPYVTSERFTDHRCATLTNYTSL